MDTIRCGATPSHPYPLLSFMITIVSAAGSFTGNHAWPQRSLGITDPSEEPAFGRNHHASQDFTTAAAWVLLDLNVRHGKAPGGIILLPLRPQFEAASGNGPKAAPGGIRRFENSIHQRPSGNIPIPTDGSSILIDDFRPARFQQVRASWGRLICRVAWGRWLLGPQLCR